MPDIDSARAAKARLADTLDADPGVRGVGLTWRHGGWAVKVNVADRSGLVDLPSEVDGVPVVAEVVGEIRPHDV